MNQRDLSSFATWWLSDQLSKTKEIPEPYVGILNEFHEAHLMLFMQSFRYDPEINRLDNELVATSKDMYQNEAGALEKFYVIRNQLLDRFYQLNQPKLDYIQATFREWVTRQS